MAKKSDILPEYAWDDDGVRGYMHRALHSPLQYRGFLETLAALEPRGRVLDAGAGPGVLTAMGAERYPLVSITALEISPYMVRQGREYLASKNLGEQVRYLEGDVADGAALRSEGKFDMIYSAYSLHEWPRPDVAIGNLLSLLSDRGVLFLHDLRRVGWMSWVPSKSAFFLAMRASYTAVELLRILQAFPAMEFSMHGDFPVTLTAIGRPSGRGR